MTTVINSEWTKDVSGNYATAADWNPDKVPTFGSGDEYNVFIGGAYTTGGAVFTVTSSANEQVGFLDIGANATFSITGGRFLVDSVVHPYSDVYNYGTIAVAAGSFLAFGKAGSPSADSSEIQNVGKVSVAGVLSLAAPWFGLFGTGALTLSGAIEGANTGSVAELENRSTIEGSGSLGTGVTLDLTNAYSGVINANAAAAMTIDTGANQINNQGTIETTGAGGLTIKSYMQLDGALTATGKGALTVLNAEIYGGGTVNVGAGSTLKLDNGVLDVGGAVTFAAKGVMETIAGNTTGIGSNNNFAGDTLDAGEIQDVGSIIIANDSTLNMNATTYGTGVIDMNGASGPTKLEVFGSGLALTNAGGVVMSNSAKNAIVSNGSGVALDNETTISGAGVIGDTWLRLVNLLDATIKANDKTSLTIKADTAAVADGSQLENNNDGTVINTGAGGIVLSGGTLNNSGFLTEDGAGAITLVDDSIDSGGGIVQLLAGKIVLKDNSQIFHQEHIMLAAGTTLTTSAGDKNDAIYTNVFNSGAVDAVADSTLAVEGHWSNSAAINVGSSTAGAILTVLSDSSWEVLGAGRINMSDANDQIVGASGSEFEDKSNLVVGGGVIGNSLMNVNIERGAEVDATLASGMILDAIAQDVSTGQTYLYNAGILQSNSAGGLTLDAAIYSPGELIADAGAKIVANDAVYGTGETIINGTGSVEFHAEADGDVHFGAATGGDLILDASHQFYGNIFGWAARDTVDLRDFAFVAGKTREDTAASSFGSLDGALFVTNGTTVSAPLYLEGNYTPAYLSAKHLAFEYASDGHLISGTSSDGTLVKLVTT